MNNAKTQATAYIGDDTRGHFSKGKQMAVDGATTAQGNRPETIAERMDDDGFQGSTLQPIRKGTTRKFFDAAENHPVIPKSSQTQFTQESIPVPSASGDASKVAGLNKVV